MGSDLLRSAFYGVRVWVRVRLMDDAKNQTVTSAPIFISDIVNGASTADKTPLAVITVNALNSSTSVRLKSSSVDFHK